MDKINDKTYKLKLSEEINQFYKDHEEEHRLKLAQMSKKIVKAREVHARNTELNKQVSKLTQTIIGLERSLNQRQKQDRFPQNTNLAIQLQAEKNMNKELQTKLIRYAEKLNALQNFIGN